MEILTNQIEPTPDATWDLIDLGAYCLDRCQRKAKDAWCIGRALIVAKEKVHAEGQDWLTWVDQHIIGISRATAYRYMALPAKFTQEELEGRRITEAYLSVGILKRRPKGGSLRKGKANPAVNETETVNLALPSWAVDDEEATESILPAGQPHVFPMASEDGSSLSGEDLSVAIHNFLPGLCAQLQDLLKFIFNCPAQDRAASWRRAGGDLAAKAKMLKAQLDRLLKEMRAADNGPCNGQRIAL